MLLQGIDRLTGEFDPVHENLPLIPLDQDTVLELVGAVIPAIANRHLDAIGELALDFGFRGCVVYVVHRGVSLFERTTELGCSFERNRACGTRANRRLGNINVMRAPFGQLPAAVLIPTAECVIATLFDVLDLGSLPEPHVAVEGGRRCFLFERATFGAAADGDRQSLNLAEPSRLAKADRGLEAGAAALLCPHLKHPRRLPDMRSRGQELLFRCKLSRPNHDQSPITDNEVSGQRVSARSKGLETDRGRFSTVCV
jgi:hypothetical protein